MESTSASEKIRAYAATLEGQPREIIIKTMEDLDYKDITALCSASKFFRSICSDKLVWLSLISKKFGSELTHITTLHFEDVGYLKSLFHILEIKPRLYRNLESQYDRARIYNNLIQILDNYPGITEVTYGNIRIGDAGAEMLAEALKHNTLVKNVTLSDIGIGVQGAKSLANMLKVNQSITTLYLNDDTIGDDGIKYIADAIKENETLKTINLMYCSIGIPGAISLADGLSVNRSITLVYLSNNRVRNEGAIALSKSIAINKNIVEFFIDHNEIGDDGLVSLARGAAQNPNFKYLSIENNVDPKVLEILRNHQAANSKFEYKIFGSDE